MDCVLNSKLIAKFKYIFTPSFFLVKNSFGKHKQTHSDACFFLFYLCCSPSSASRAKNTSFFPKHVLFLKADNFQMVAVVDKICWQRTWVWCIAGEYTGHPGDTRGHKGCLALLAGGQCSVCAQLRSSHSAEAGAAPSASCCTEPSVRRECLS